MSFARIAFGISGEIKNSFNLKNCDQQSQLIVQRASNCGKIKTLPTICDVFWLLFFSEKNRRFRTQRGLANGFIEKHLFEALQCRISRELFLQKSMAHRWWFQKPRCESFNGGESDLPLCRQSCKSELVDREISHRVLARIRDEARRGSSVNFKDETDIIRNGLSAMVVPKPNTPPNEPTGAKPPGKSRISWARLLKRVFGIDIQTCHVCSGKMKIIAAIEDPAVIKNILSHLGLPNKPPEPWPARGPPAPNPFEPQQHLDII